jgi:steroid delta-isomerase-like uncharacterized protein
MTQDEIEAVAHRWHLEVVQAGKLEVADAILAPDVVVHANGQEVRGVDAAKQLASAFPIAFPDLQITHHEAIVVGNRVAIRWTSDATHQGDYFGMAPSGQRIHFEGLDFFHFQDGKIAEVWIAYDNLGPFQQAGVIPQS